MAPSPRWRVCFTRRRGWCNSDALRAIKSNKINISSTHYGCVRLRVSTCVFMRSTRGQIRTVFLSVCSCSLCCLGWTRRNADNTVHAFKVDISHPMLLISTSQPPPPPFQPQRGKNTTSDICLWRTKCEIINIQTCTTENTCWSTTTRAADPTPNVGAAHSLVIILPQHPSHYYLSVCARRNDPAECIIPCSREFAGVTSPFVRRRARIRPMRLGLVGCLICFNLIYYFLSCLSHILDSRQKCWFFHTMLQHICQHVCTRQVCDKWIYFWLLGVHTRQSERVKRCVA